MEVLTLQQKVFMLTIKTPTMKTHIEARIKQQQQQQKRPEERINTLQSSLQSLPSCATMSPGAWRKYGLKKRS